MCPDVPDGQPIVIHPALHGEVDALAAAIAPHAEAAAPTPVVTVRGDVARPAAVAAPSETAEPAQRRAFSVDALRGMFLVSMTLGFAVGYPDFPLWMYHRQQPPPTYELVKIPGVSWRDLAYGAFLFTMAAALPLTLGRRVEKGETELGVIFGAIKRYGMLLLFALLVGHANTFFIGYTQTGRVLALVGFSIMALVYTRRREDWDETRFDHLNKVGWALAIVFLALTPMFYGKQFTPTRHDDIITGLAFASLTGAVLWYVTRDRPRTRLVVLAVVVGLCVASRSSAWVQSWWWSSPAEWAFSASMLQLLAIVVPGTLAGDAVLRWMRAVEPPGLARWSRGRALAFAAVAAALTPMTVVGLYTRQLVANFVAVVLACGLALYLASRPLTATERMLRSLMLWSATWLILGLLIEPLEGGIMKAPETISYFFVVGGLTTALLAAVATLIEGMGLRKGFSPFIDVGHNPLLAYVLYTVFINSALELIPATRDLLTGSPVQAALRMVLAAGVVVLIVGAISRRRIYWRT